MAPRQPTAFFYLEQGRDELVLYSLDLEEPEGTRKIRMDYTEYTRVRELDDLFDGTDNPDIYRLAEIYLEEHPVDALESELTEEGQSRKIADRLRQVKQEREVKRDDLARMLGDENLTEIVKMSEFRERISVELGNTVV